MKQGKLFDIPPKPAIAVEPVLATGFCFGDKVLYKMNYNGLVDWWEGVVINEQPNIRLAVKFLDGFKTEVNVGRQQMQYLKKACH